MGGKRVRHPEALVRCSLIAAGNTPSLSHSLTSMLAVPEILAVVVQVARMVVSPVCSEIKALYY